MQFVTSFLYFALFGFLIARLPFFRNVQGLSTPWLVFFFALKVVAGSLLIFIYTWYYEDPLTADVYKYFQDGSIMFAAIKDNPADYFRMLTGIDGSASHLAQYYDEMRFWYRPWDSPFYNDNRLVIRFNALVSLFSFGHIFVHNVFINFLSFTGLVALYKFMIRYSDKTKQFWLAAGVFLFPGLLFWGSGILKEGLLLWALGWWILLLDNVVSRHKSWLIQLFFLGAFSGFLILLKPYTFFLWLPCIIAFYISRNYASLRSQLTYPGVIALFAVTGFGLIYFFSSYDPLQVIANRQNDFIYFSLEQDAGSLIHTRLLTPDFMMISVEFVRGFFNALLRPHIFEAYSVVTLMAAVENTLILVMVLYMIWRLEKRTLTSSGLHWAGLWFMILLLGFVGMISPAHGGIVRYKIPAIPFMWLFFVQMTRLPHLDKHVLSGMKISKYFRKRNRVCE
ncbi:MAG: hypothetical protein EA361_12280 [Bacteroidetes bacterium]|nr:MAG: hypothetical protein EA361_12280 [Bacteroidota bacterium]